MLLVPILSSVCIPPLHNGAQGLAEAALLVAACCVGYIHCELRLHSDVVLQSDIADLQITFTQLSQACFWNESQASMDGVVVHSGTRSQGCRLVYQPAADLNLLKAPFSKQLDVDWCASHFATVL